MWKIKMKNILTDDEDFMIQSYIDFQDAGEHVDYLKEYDRIHEMWYIIYEIINVETHARIKCY